MKLKEIIHRNNSSRKINKSYESYNTYPWNLHADSKVSPQKINIQKADDAIVIEEQGDGR